MMFTSLKILFFFEIVLKAIPSASLQSKNQRVNPLLQAVCKLLKIIPLVVEFFQEFS